LNRSYRFGGKYNPAGNGQSTYRIARQWSVLGECAYAANCVDGKANTVVIVGHHEWGRCRVGAMKPNGLSPSHGEPERISLELPKPWLQRAGESGKAHNAFRLYLEMGSNRSVLEVSRRLAKSANLIKRWSSRWNWVQRARHYDNWMAQQVQERVVRRLQEQADHYAKIAGDRLLQLTEAEKAELTLQETALCSRMALELSGRDRAELQTMAVADGKLHITVSLIPERPEGYAYVRFGADTSAGWTWIPIEEAATYARAHPDHLVVA
jgi:hypothetical protein